MVAHQTKKPPNKTTKTRLPTPNKILEKHKVLTTKNKHHIIATTIHYYHNPQNTTQKIKQTLNKPNKLFLKNISFGFLSARIVFYWFMVSNASMMLAAIFLTITELYLYRKVFDNDEIFG